MYQLIKNNHNYLLYSDEKIETLEEDKVLLINGVLCRTELRKGQVVSRHLAGGATIDICKTECVKVIASLNEIQGIPLLTFTDEVAKVVGYVDVMGLSKKWFDILSKKIQPRELSLYNKYTESFRASFESGYNRCLQDNKDRLYTLLDLRHAYEEGLDEGYGREELSYETPMLIDMYAEKIINQKKQWNVEIEMEEHALPMPNIHVTEYHPKVTNNTIKVISIK